VVCVTQDTGLLANDPLACPEEIFTLLSVVEQRDSRRSTERGLVLPPARDSGGENVNLAEKEHVTVPGAALIGAADAGLTVANTPPAARSTAATASHACRYETAFSAPRRTAMKSPLSTSQPGHRRPVAVG